MHVQIVSLAAVRSVARRESTDMAGAERRLWYVIAKCPCAGPSYLYGTWPWCMSHSVRDFQRKEREKRDAQQ